MFNDRVALLSRQVSTINDHELDFKGAIVTRSRTFLLTIYTDAEISLHTLLIQYCNDLLNLLNGMKLHTFLHAIILEPFI